MVRLRQIQQAGAFLGILVCTSSALADATLPVRLIPEYTPCEYKKQRYACFTDEQMLELYALEIDAKGWYSNWRYYYEISAAQINQLKVTTVQIDKLTTMQQRAEDRVEKLQSQLFEQIEHKTELQNKLENPPRWPLWVGGSLAIFGAGGFLAALIVR